MYQDGVSLNVLSVVCMLLNNFFFSQEHQFSEFFFSREYNLNEKFDDFLANSKHFERLSEKRNFFSIFSITFFFQMFLTF